MLNRWIGIVSAAGMILANAALLSRDVLPDWRAGDPPPSEPLLLEPGESRQVQVGIHHADGRRLGTSWTCSRRPGADGIVMVTNTTVLDPIPLAGRVATPRVRIEMNLTYRSDEARVDEMKFTIVGLSQPVSIHAETMLSGEFPCKWQIGPQEGKVMLDAQAPVLLGDAIRPFDRLPDLYVGRSWHLKLLDPLAHILPELKTSGLSLETTLVQVTRHEELEHGGQQVDTLVVEGAGATAWVAHDGRVLRQEVTLPLIGRLVLLDEPYDDDARRNAVHARGLSDPPDAGTPASAGPSLR